MSDLEAIIRLTNDFGHELDRGTADGFAALFTDDALYTFGERVTNGRDAIRAFYVNRTVNGPRVSRHVATGLRVDFASETRATGISVCSTFSAAGEGVIDSTVFAVVADFEDVYVKEDGHWLFAERHIIAVFRAAPVGG